MTDKKTMALNARQWRVLLHDNLDVLKAYVAGNETITEEGLRQICTQLDDMKMLAGAWFQVGKEPATADVPAQANGAAPAPKRGWPKGKKRNQVTQAVQ